MKKTKEQRKNSKKKNINYHWIIEITTLSFLISIGFSFISETTLPKVNIGIQIILIFLFIIIGIIFDMIGVAVASADEQPFHSMASKKVRGAKVAITFKKNADKVASFCNDVIGDICGIISGAAGSIISLTISSSYNIDTFFITLIITGIIASLTIGGKALGKTIAMNKSNTILYEFSKIVSFVYHPKK